jgi:hypothetical protein
MLSDIFHTNSYTMLGTLTLTADNSAFMIMELGSWRVSIWTLILTADFFCLPDLTH